MTGQSATFVKVIDPSVSAADTLQVIGDVAGDGRCEGQGDADPKRTYPTTANTAHLKVDNGHFARSRKRRDGKGDTNAHIKLNINSKCAGRHKNILLM